MRAEKESITNELKEKIDSSIFVIFADYRGMSMMQTDELRTKLHDVEARFQVVPNRAARLAAGELADAGLNEGLKGPSAMVYGEGDVVQAAKTLREFIKQNMLPVVKIGALRGSILSAEDIDTLSKLPSREELYAQVVGTIAAPMTQVVGALHQKVCSLLYVLKAIEEKKSAA